MEETEKRLEILKIIHIFKHIVQNTFVYLYYKAYSQDVDVYNYILGSKKVDLFLENEVKVLEKNRNPEKWTFDLIFKILKSCCEPKINSWDSSIRENSDTLHLKLNQLEVDQLLQSIEKTINFLYDLYKSFLISAEKMTANSFEELAEIIEKSSMKLVDFTSSFSDIQLVEKEKKMIANSFLEIKNGNFGVDEKNIAKTLKIECDFRAEMVCQSLTEELKEVADFNWHLEMLNFDQDNNVAIEDDYTYKEEIDPKTILSIVEENGHNICWISGEHGIGKSSFAASILASWYTKQADIAGLEKFSAVLAISLMELQKLEFGEGNICEYLFPLSSKVVSKENFENWIKNENILVIFDDVNRHSDKIIEQIHKEVKVNCNLKVCFMGRLSSLLKYITKPEYSKCATFFELRGLREENILSRCEKYDQNSNGLSLKIKLKDNMNRLCSFLKYPTIFRWTCQMWTESPRSFNEIYSASDLMWQILIWSVRKYIKINLRKSGKIKKMFLSWLMKAGELSLYCLKADYRLDNTLLEELGTEITKRFPGNGRKIFEFMFRPSITYSHSSCLSNPASTCKPFLEYLSSWYFTEELLKDKPIKQLTDGLVNKLPLILLAAGHMERFQDQGTVTIPEERKVIKALVNYREKSYDDFSFIQKFVAEMRCIRRLVQIVIDETEYNIEWNLNFSEVQFKSLQVLLSFVSPTRLIFLANDSKKNYELNNVMDYVCRVEISVWLDSIPQFTYGSKQKMDTLLKPFLHEDVIPKLDLLSGALTTNMMLELSKSKATQHLVLLRLKITSEKQLKGALYLPSRLPNLMWLEIKIDTDIRNIKVANIRPTNVPLFDVYVRHLQDADTTFLAELLTAMHRRFTGIHLEETDLTPEGVYTLLKELGKRKVTLRGKEEDIVKFRRWYYCGLNNIPADQTLTEQDCINLLGHDDRGFFSDHHVTSTKFVTALEAWNLRSYLEDQSNIIKFKYISSNIIFKKNLEGEVSIDFKGEYKDKIEETIMKQNRSNSREEVHKQVLAFY